MPPEPTILQAAVLGLLQGLAEFLPISSSAHLSLAPWAFGWPEPGLAFDVALHLGTLVAVLWYFRRDWIALWRAALASVRARGLAGPDGRRLGMLVAATVPGAAIGYAFQKQAETIFRAPALTAAALMVMGVILWVVDSRAPSRRPLAEMTWRDALMIGLAQACAIVPGVSRSGGTITAARALGFDRGGAATFSFLMSMPIIGAAAALKAPEALGAPHLAPVLVGMVAAAVSGWAAIAGLLTFLRTRGFGAFAAYRLVLGAAVLALVWMRSR
ncbi:MAG TPA: undecaprenyl-diphosphate phosphatase [Gemmatimonadaceae bacterium]|nr:undecaprenyl-diphosphate phosphatase [Gemmatimonadaceae bacterium]